MAKLRAIKTSFNGGEISKQLFGRVDLESFIASNKQMKNVLPTIYGSAMNRGGTVFVDDNLKLFFETVQQTITGAESLNPLCVSVDYSFSHYMIGCANGYLIKCDFDFGNPVIIQLTYGGNPLGNITSVANAAWWGDRNTVKISTAEGSYVYIPQDASWSNTGAYVNPNDSNPEKLFTLSPDQNPLRNQGRIVSFDGLKLRKLKTVLSGGFDVENTYDVSDNSTADFDGWYINDDNFLLRNETNLFWYKNGSVISLGINDATVLGAKLNGSDKIDVYVYKQIDTKYCLCCDTYDNAGELLREIVVAKFDDDCDFRAGIYINDKWLFVGVVKSVAVYRNTVFEYNGNHACRGFAINGNNIIYCSGFNVYTVDSYSASTNTAKSVLIPFKINKQINYILEFGEQVIRVYKNRQPVTSGGAVYEINSPYSITDLIDDEGKLRISYVQSVDVLYICHKDFPIQTLKRYSDTNWVLEDFTLVGGPFNDANTDKNKTLSSSQTEGLITINAVNNSSVCNLIVTNYELYNRSGRKNRTIWYLDDVAIYTNNNSFLSLDDAILQLLGTTDGANFNVTRNGNIITVTVKASSQTYYGGKVLRLWRDKYVADLMPNVYQVRRYDDSATFVASGSSTNVFSANDVGKLIRLNYIDSNTVMWESGKSVSIGNIRKSGNNYYKATSAGTTGQIKPTHTEGIVSDGAVFWEYLHSGYGVGTILEVVSASQIKVNADGYFPDFTYGTYLWELGVIGDGVYPNCCAFYKERFIFSISTNRGTKICASCAGDYNNFSDNSFGDILPESAITVLLQGNQESLVLWMTAINKLYIGTACEEFIFGEQTIAEVLSPTNVMCVRVSSLGSAAIMPLHILDELFFISNNEKQIANFTYIAERDSFRPMNISVMFEHLLHNGVKCWAYTKEPYKTIWFSDKDGNLRSISYDADNKVCAGARHDIGGKIISLAVIPEPNGNYDELWMVVERGVAGQTVYYTERLSWGLPQEDVTDDYKNKHQVFSDCAKVVEYDENTSEVGGLYFLEGKTVKVVVDGVIQEDKVVSDGAITLDKPGKVIVVGLGYDWLIETLFINIGANDGTAQALPQRVAKLMARCINTRYLTSKATGGNRYDVVCNSDVLVDDDFEIHLPSDYSRQMTIFFAGDKPVSCCILAIVAEMKTYQ